MDFKVLVDIISLMKESDIEEIEFSADKIRVKRFARNLSPQELLEKPEIVKNPAVDEKIHEEKRNLYTVNSPFVGTFYRSPSPGAQPFVEIGDIVKKGKTLCIVEAMKLMNEIEAEVTGKVVQILKKDGESVEFGEPLFIIEPSEQVE